MTAIDQREQQAADRAEKQQAKNLSRYRELVYLGDTLTAKQADELFKLGEALAIEAERTKQLIERAKLITKLRFESAGLDDAREALAAAEQQHRDLVRELMQRIEDSAGQVFTIKQDLERKDNAAHRLDIVTDTAPELFVDPATASDGVRAAWGQRDSNVFRG